MPEPGPILVTHVGSLPQPPELADELARRDRGFIDDQEGFEKRVAAAVHDVLRRQVDCGVDVVGDGEMSKSGFKTYVGSRLGGIERTVTDADGPRPNLWAGTRDAAAFPDFYRPAAEPAGSTVTLSTIAPLHYAGQDQVARDIATLREALGSCDRTAAFMPAASPGTVAGMLANKHYATDEEHLYAVADAMREEYQAILDGGLLLQIDDPRPLTYYMRSPQLSLPQWRAWTQIRIEALNHALRGLPMERIRYHTCYGINMGPRAHDIEFQHVLPLLLTVHAGAYSFEAANPRHEHEWRLWEHTAIPDDKVLIPGLVTQSSVLVEHPDLVAGRLMRFVGIVGPERVIAGTDCGFSTSPGFEHIDDAIVWAKLAALSRGTAQVNATLRRS